MELFSNTEKSAVISDCGKYRYSLTRTWNDELPKVMFVMLNPSTADAMKDDPTIRRCVGFANSWGYGGIIVVNLFAFRATNPKELLSEEHPIGGDNLYYMRKAYDKVDKVVCAWGNKPILRKWFQCKSFNESVLVHFIKDKSYYLELSKDGTPKHPLYLKKDLKPKKL